MQTTDDGTFYGRRKFLSSVTTLMGGSMVMGLPRIGLSETGGQRLTVKQIIDVILKEIPNAPFAATVDQLRSGSLEQEVTGIVTTMFPTLDVIEKAAKAGANFIVAHETPFYNNQDETEWLKEDDAYRHKVSLLNKHKIAIWRFHDYWHAHKPDGIILGNLIKLGWDQHYDVSSPRLLTLPKPMSLKSIALLAKERLGISNVRVIGDLNRGCSTIYLAFGYMDSKRQIAAIQEYKPDLILSGETREWETVERVRDGIQMGLKTSLLVLSHSVSEEAGMEYAAVWLRPKVPGVDVKHIASGNPFSFL
jgi:putative NIF3 family GTP cyclohydrolase 1 type 2